MVSTLTFALFAGAFNLLNITRTQNGTVIPDSTYGDNPAGVIMYTQTGFMSALLTSTDAVFRPLDLTLPAQDNQSDIEWANVGRHTLAYSGPFHFDGTLASSKDIKHGQIIHGPLISSTLPRFVGSLQHRNFSFSTDGVYLNLVGDLGNGVIDNLWWERLSGNISINT